MLRRTYRLVTAVAVLLSIACQAEKSSNPLSPSVAGPIAGVNIAAPTLLEPNAGWRIEDKAQPLRLLLENASSTGERPPTYVFEVATDLEIGRAHV